MMISPRTKARMSFIFTGLAWATGAWSQPPSWTRVDLDGRILWQDPRWTDQGRPWNGHTRLHLPGLPGADPAGAFRADGRAVLPSLDVHRTR